MPDTTITIEIHNCKSSEAQTLLDQLSARLLVITGSSGKASFDPANTESAGGLFVLARNSEATAIGCGALQRIDHKVAEIKRVYSGVESSGIGSAIIDFLERQAWQMGYLEIWLETRIVNQRAINFYLKHGYQIIENYGKYAGNKSAICLKKFHPDLQIKTG